MKKIIFIAFLSVFLLPITSLGATPRSLKTFPKGSTPREVGEKLAYHFAVSKHALHAGKWIGYPETFTWNGALWFAKEADDKRLISLLADRFHFLFGSEKHLLPPQNHVDLNMFGSLPLTLYSLTSEEKYLRLGLPYADSQWALPTNASPQQISLSRQGYSWQTRLWIDDMYMITILQTTAYRVTQHSQYIERAAKEMALYLDSLQCPNGLFFHAPDVPFHWARGNGWVAAGLTELLKELPSQNLYYPRIMQGYLKLMEGLRHYQNSEGLWNQLIDRADSGTETSGSAMFTYALINGVKRGWLSKKIYATLARKAWLAMITYITPQGDVRAVCAGTNKRNDLQYYYNRPRNTGDYHGQAPYLWCAAALLEK